MNMFDVVLPTTHVMAYVETTLSTGRVSANPQYHANNWGLNGHPPAI